MISREKTPTVFRRWGVTHIEFAEPSITSLSDAIVDGVPQWAWNDSQPRYHAPKTTKLFQDSQHGFRS